MKLTEVATNNNPTELPPGMQPHGSVGVKCHAHIRSLEGAPSKVMGDFVCDHTKITSLQGAPQHIGGYFDCTDTKITSLQGAPQHIGGSFFCMGTKITSLQGAPAHVGGAFDCRDIKSLTSLQGAPAHVGTDFHCSGTKITSLQGAPAYVGRHFSCSGTQITSLQGVHKYFKTKINATLYLPTDITHLLGLLFCPGVRKIDGPYCTEIINKYLAVVDRDVHACQEELIDAGFVQQARL